MPKITRRFRVVTLPQGDHDATLASLKSDIVVAETAEGLGIRFGEKSAVAATVRAYNKAKVAAEADAVKVTVYALAYNEFGPLQDLHGPREGDPLDRAAGYNRKSFPHALTKASMVEPGSAVGDTEEDRLADLIGKGDAAFAELGSLSHVHYSKLLNEAWDVNVGDDSLPPYSGESLLKAVRDRDSKRQPDSE